MILRLFFSTNVIFTLRISPLIGAEDSGGEGGHQVVGQAEQHDGAREPSQHWWVQVVDHPERGRQKTVHWDHLI